MSSASSIQNSTDPNRVILYMDYISQPCRAVLAYMMINQIPYEIREIRIFKGQTLTDEFKAISPTQKLPTIVHQGFTLVESHAILTYLASVFPVDEQWYPRDPKIRAQIDCYLHWHHANIRHAVSSFLYHKKILPKITGQQISEELEKEFLRSQHLSFKFIENILKQGLYVGRTQRPSIADISCYCEAIQLYLVNFNYEKYPEICRWMREIGEIPAIKEASKPFFKIVQRVKL
ncbi:unnamed protein product [Blepharisma stoltei]|uniref:Glutathione S-transferase n=1 Tax=Blepharisma stoltei TaxID=1481888 RepID=A0AAU9JPG5_9CILI|nr:unnamed protein product [Blepharisma stoltei]